MQIKYQIALDVETEEGCVELQHMPVLYVNSIALQFQDESIIQFKVVEFVLIVLTIPTSLICGAHYIIMTITYECQTIINIISLISLVLLILPTLTLCSKTFKMSIQMITLVQILYLIMIAVLSYSFFFFMSYRSVDQEAKSQQQRLVKFN